VGDYGAILHTTDGGQTWTPEKSGVSSSSLRALHAADKDSCWAFGEWGWILRRLPPGE